MKQLECPNCHLKINENDTHCPFCGHDLSKEIDEINAEASKPQEVHVKKKISLHTIIYIACFFASLVPFLLMLLPALSVEGTNYSAYYYLTKSTLQIGANTPTIVFVFSIVGTLNLAAVLRSIQKKTTEISLFSYFSVLMFVAVAVFSFLGGTLASTGTTALKYTTSIGLILIGIWAVLIAAAVIVATIFFKRFLVESPLENAKTE